MNEKTFFPDEDDNGVPVCNTGCPACKVFDHSNRGYCSLHPQVIRVEDGDLCYPAIKSHREYMRNLTIEVSLCIDDLTTALCGSESFEEKKYD